MMHPTNRFQPVTAYHPFATPPSATVSSREWPTLTIYRDGLANLNGLATELLRQAKTVELVAPPPVQAGRAQKAWQLHTGGSLALIPHGSRVSTRFRALAAATALFAGLPTELEALRFVLTPEPGRVDRWRLLPV
jgi:hypothetical protein